jgi:hypothetical protein
MSAWHKSRLAIATIALGAVVALLLDEQLLGAEPVQTPVEQLRSLVDGYARAIETNNLELALWYVHPLSPRRSEIAVALREQLASYLEHARTSSLEPLRQGNRMISARVDQEFVRVFGMKFTRGTRRSTYHFREHGGTWRIWEVDELPAQ